jgi:hypothetical protein
MERRMFLARIVRAQVVSLPDESDLWIAKGRLRIADKIAAIRLDNELAGEGDGGEIDVPVRIGGREDIFSALLAEIRR